MGQLSFSLSADKLAEWETWLQRRHRLTILWPDAAGLDAHSFPAREIYQRPLARMQANRMAFVDALVVQMAEDQRRRGLRHLECPPLPGQDSPRCADAGNMQARRFDIEEPGRLWQPTYERRFMSQPDDLVRDFTALSPADQASARDYIAFLRWRGNTMLPGGPTLKGPAHPWQFNLLEHFAGADVRAHARPPAWRSRPPRRRWAGSAARPSGNIRRWTARR